MRNVDIAIAGGGPAGAAAATVLARAGLRVLLADTGAGRKFKIGEGLPPSARSLLRELGVLERVLADGHRTSYGTLAFWGSHEARAHDFLFQLHGYGLQLDRLRFDAALLQCARQAGVDIHTPAKLSLPMPRAAISTDNGRHQLRLRSNDREETIASRWLIDASGRPAVLARRLGAMRRQYDALLAFHMRLATEEDRDQDGRTWVEAVENGWWYSVLLPSRQRLVAFLGDADLIAQHRVLHRDGLWAAMLQTRSLQQLCRSHGYVPIEAPHGADASSSCLDSAAGERWLAVGDAALAFDPLSSKGIANALYTGLRGAQAIINTLRGDAHATARYAAHLLDIHRVYREQLQTFYAMEARWSEAAFWKRRLMAAVAAHSHSIVAGGLPLMS